MKQFVVKVVSACVGAPLFSVFLALGLGSAQAAPPPMFIVGNVNGLQGEQVVVPIEVDAFSKMNTFQFSFHWDATNAAFVGVEQFGVPGLSAGLFGTTHSNIGTINVSWDDPNPDGGGQNLPDGTTLFAVRLLLLGTNGSPPTLLQIPTNSIDQSIQVEISVNNNGSIDSVTPILIPGQLTIGEPNTAPVLNAIGNKVVDEGSQLSFVASASDGNLPPQLLTYTLDAGAPDGAAIDPVTGLFTWTPAEGQGPSNYPVTIRVTDSGYPPATVSETITITVNEMNTAPTVAFIANQTVNEGTLLTFTNSATDTDLPAQALTYSLSNAPSGALIDPVTGVFNWTPTEAQGPGSYAVTIVVVDNGSPPLSNSLSITITVNEVNTAPTFGFIANQTVNEGTLLTFTNSATDTDLPAQALTYSLSNAPSGALIDPVTGVFTWTPTEVQGPGSYPVTIVVVDGGSPPLSNSLSISITVNEVNTAPTLAFIANQTVDEGTLLTFTNSATDTDLPAQALTYSLSNAPSGALIDPVTGVFTWTPTEAQGPSNYPVTIVVVDSGSPSLSNSISLSITVNEVNTAPNLPAIGNQTAFEGHLLTFTIAATDADVPAQTLTYSLLGAPSGAAIDSATGLFTWTPPEVIAQTSNTLSVVVRDDGAPSLSATQTLTITILKTNNPPVFSPSGPYFAGVLQPFKLTNVVTDVDSPLGQITFGIDAAPKGVHINRLTGLLVWVPSKDQARSTNVISVFAIDDGSPPASSTNSFEVIVGDYLELSLGRLVLRTGESGSVDVTVTNTTTLTNLTSLLLVSPEDLTGLSLSGLAPQLSSGTLTPLGSGVSQLEFTTVPGQVFQPGQTLAQLNFSAISTQSTFVPLLLSNVVSIQSNGLPLDRSLANSGRVVVVANEPLVEALPTTNSQSMLVLYGQTGSNYVVQSTPIPAGPSSDWQFVWQGTLTNLFQPIESPLSNSAPFFFRSFRQ